MTLRCYRCGADLEGDEAVGMWRSDFGVYICMNEGECNERISAVLKERARIRRHHRKASAATSNLAPGAERKAESA